MMLGADYNSRARVQETLRRSPVVVVINRNHVKTPEHLVQTMWEVYQAGYVAECTFRIDIGLIREAMTDLRRMRLNSPSEHPFLLGVGSVINPAELETAIELGFDMIVAPANVMGGHGEGKEFIALCHAAGIFAAPAVFTPTELQYFIERPDALEPDAIKVFPADSHGPSGIKALLAPFVRERHAGRMIMPTGGVNLKTASAYFEAIQSTGFTPVLGMSAPLELVEKSGGAGDLNIIRDSLRQFQSAFQPTA